jgi:hypothetical protein
MPPQVLNKKLDRTILDFLSSYVLLRIRELTFADLNLNPGASGCVDKK